MAEPGIGRRILSLFSGLLMLLLFAAMIDGCQGCTDRYQDADGLPVRYAGKIVVTDIAPATDQGFFENRMTFDGDWKTKKVIRWKELEPFSSVGDLQGGIVERRHLDGVITVLSYDTARYTLMPGDTLDLQISPATTSIGFVALLTGGNSRRGFFIEQIDNIESVYQRGGRAGRAIPIDNRVHSWVGRNIGMILGVVALLAAIAVVMAIFRRRSDRAETM